MLQLPGNTMLQGQPWYLNFILKSVIWYKNFLACNEMWILKIEILIKFAKIVSKSAFGQPWNDFLYDLAGSFKSIRIDQKFVNFH